jgi:hypothetical protein
MLGKILSRVCKKEKDVRAEALKDIKDINPSDKRIVLSRICMHVKVNRDDKENSAAQGHRRVLKLIKRLIKCSKCTLIKYSKEYSSIFKETLLLLF